MQKIRKVGSIEEELVGKCGFQTSDDLLDWINDQAEIVFEEGDTKWYIMPTPDGHWVAWDDAAGYPEICYSREEALKWQEDGIRIAFEEHPDYSIEMLEPFQSLFPNLFDYLSKKEQEESGEQNEGSKNKVTRRKETKRVPSFYRARKKIKASWITMRVFFGHWGLPTNVEDFFNYLSENSRLVFSDEITNWYIMPTPDEHWVAWNDFNGWEVFETRKEALKYQENEIRILFEEHPNYPIEMLRPYLDYFTDLYYLLVSRAKKESKDQQKSKIQRERFIERLRAKSIDPNENLNTEDNEFRNLFRKGE